MPYEAQKSVSHATGGLVDRAAFILANTDLLPVEGLPHIRLYAAHPASGLSRLMGQGGDPTPYWAYAWPGGVALAHYVAAYPQAVAGRRVLDLGAGSGLVAIAAAKGGAAQVIAADTDPNAIAAAGLNAAANDVTITLLEADITMGAPPDVDLITVGDMVYAADLAKRVSAFLQRCHAAGIATLIGDLGRAYLPHGRLQAIATYPVHDVGEAKSASRSGTVYRFTG